MNYKDEDKTKILYLQDESNNSEVKLSVDDGNLQLNDSDVGIRGDDGEDGADGTNGVDGQDGATGLKGDQGDSGIQGVAGADGLNGQDGQQGIPGTNGVDGQDGESAYALAVAGGFIGTLAVWLLSLAGAPGLNGNDGADGVDGQDGTPGADGQDGAQGSQGDPGTDGADGQDGAPGPSINIWEQNFAHRFYCYTDKRWITAMDDNYSFAYYQGQESGGTGVDQINEWEHIGIYVKAGTKLKNFTLVGWTNTAEVTDLQVRLIERVPNPITRWETGFDGDGELTNITILDDKFMVPALPLLPFTGASNDMHRRTYEIDHTFASDSFLSLWVKPEGVITATRYFRTTTQFEWER